LLAEVLIPGKVEAGLRTAYLMTNSWAPGGSVLESDKARRGEVRGRRA